MRVKGVVAGPPFLNERCSSLLRAPRLQNDLYCVEWDVKLLPYHTMPPIIIISGSAIADMLTLCHYNTYLPDV